jgi:hypothetical protein
MMRSRTCLGTIDERDIKEKNYRKFGELFPPK